MGAITTDSNDPRLKRGIDDEPVPQNEAYIVLPKEERTRGYMRDVRRSYKHLNCGTVTHMGLELAQTYARDPKFYGATYCVHCSMHRPVGEFVWEGTNEVVGS